MEAHSFLIQLVLILLSAGLVGEQVTENLLYHNRLRKRV